MTINYFNCRDVEPLPLLGRVHVGDLLLPGDAGAHPLLEVEHGDVGEALALVEVEHQGAGGLVLAVEGQGAEVAQHLAGAGVLVDLNQNWGLKRLKIGER